MRATDANALPEIRVPKRLGVALSRLWARRSGKTVLGLHIVIRDRRIIARQFAAYLGLADRVYGRLVFGSLKRYARRRNEHFTISEIRRGSLVLVVREVLDTLTSPAGLILTGLALKYLPEVIKAPAVAYRDYQQAKLHRAERRRLEARASIDEDLGKLSVTELNQLTRVLTKIYDIEQSKLLSAQQFAIRSVIEVRIERSETH